MLEQIHRKSCPWKLLSGAIDALVDIERLPAAAPVLAERLDHDHPQVRGVAARGMLMLKDKAAPYADLLVERLRVEQSLDLAEVLAAALVGLGSRSIKPLLELVDDGNLLRTELALRALTLTGPDGAAAVGELLRPGQSPRLHKLAASVLFQMGRRALPALPGLCRVLDTTTVPDVALNCVIAVTGMGPEATAAIPSLIVRLAEFDSKDDAAAEWAFVALLKLRGQAIPAVEAELERASGPSKERLSVLLARLTATSLGRTARLERIQDDGLVRDFVAVAGLIQAADPTKPPATRDLAKMLNERRVIPASAPAKDGKGWSQQRVSRTIKLMQEATKVRLTTVSCRQKGSLTPDVIRLLADARQYLELVALRQGEQN